MHWRLRDVSTLLRINQGVIWRRILVWWEVSKSKQELIFLTPKSLLVSLKSLGTKTKSFIKNPTRFRIISNINPPIQPWLDVWFWHLIAFSSITTVMAGGSSDQCVKLQHRLTNSHPYIKYMFTSNETTNNTKTLPCFWRLTSSGKNGNVTFNHLKVVHHFR